VVTSPPYADQRRYGFKKGEFRWDHVVPRALAAVNLAPDGQMLVNLGLVHRDGEVVCYWEPMIHTLRSFGYRLFGWYPWDQGFGLMGDWQGRLAPSHEWIFHFNKESKRPNKTQPCKGHGTRKCCATFRKSDGTVKPLTHNGKAVQPFKIPDSVIRINREMARNIGGHPAPYPVALADFMLKAFNGSVVDPFMGGGTTLIAAHRLGRRAIGIEIEERYCEIAAKRLQQEVLPLEQVV
jgi:DNA modification methylase